MRRNGRRRANHHHPNTVPSVLVRYGIIPGTGTGTDQDGYQYRLEPGTVLPSRQVPGTGINTRYGTCTGIISSYRRVAATTTTAAARIFSKKKPLQIEKYVHVVPK